MREIKFRAWENNEHILLPVISIDFDDEVIQLSMNDTLWGSTFNQVNQVELMQYTGLKDKNGVEIYEGDVVHIESERVKQGLFHGDTNVIYEDGCYFVKTTRMRWPISVFRTIEVIGNIYENPELLEETK